MRGNKVHKIFIAKTAKQLVYTGNLRTRFALGFINLIYISFL